MKAYFQKLYSYNQWANLGLLKYFKELPSVPDQVMLRMCHIVAAEEIWYDRIQSLDFEPMPVFKIQTMKFLEPRLRDSAQRCLDLIDDIEDFEVPVSYHNLAGKPYRSELSDILIHLANHGSYHRGQIATLLRQQDLEPLPTDYILYTRA